MAPNQNQPPKPIEINQCANGFMVRPVVSTGGYCGTESINVFNDIEDMFEWIRERYPEQE